ncbi:UDP-N-acetylmuramate dehydrogenase [Roseivirga sp. BDSF3-8]|uniref:UDP-N-acetylmuramate dehydrogenase n=1 Tax=Roseivirga sp. BDSF3-8 TaxID=3241598 RepID=UPI0035320478
MTNQGISHYPTIFATFIQKTDAHYRMQVQENVSLKPYNSFGIEADAKYFAEVTSVADLQKLLKDSRYLDATKLILGGGSNVLMTGHFDGIVIKMNIKGIEEIRKDEAHTWLRIGAGENWHQFVLNTIDRGLSGVENLSLIPGTVGAAPMQNIGAYGVELCEVFEKLEAVEISSGKVEHFDHDTCHFGYRESIFKKELKGRHIITHVTLRLNNQPSFNTSYGAIKQVLEERNITELSTRAISDAVIHIRQSKLPDPRVIGNAGSFFKNPVISIEEFNRLQAAFPEVPHYPQSDGTIKVPAGWLIEQAGWKGKRVGHTGVHDRQALVLVNHGGAQGHEVVELAKSIQASVKEKFGIGIRPEVNII